MENLNTSSDASATSWLSDLLLDEIEDCNLFQQCDQNLLDDEEFLSHDIATVLQEGILDQPMLSSESYTSYHVSNSETLINSSTDETNLNRPTKKIKTKNTTSNLQHLSISPTSSHSSHTSQNISFENLDPLSSPATYFHGFGCTLNTKQNEDVLVQLSQPQHRNMTQNHKGSSKNPQGRGTKRSLANAHDHIIAERKRREKLSQSLIALAALIPGLKKMDKASVLGDAIKYVKELQERLKVLEEEKKKSSAVECDDHSNSSSKEKEKEKDNVCNECEVARDEERLPHVEARVSDNNVLLRIHCEKQKGLLLKIMVEIQSLNLSIVNSSVLPFGDSILDITIVAQMGKGNKLTRKNDIVKNIRVAALRSMS